jgi:hypothetical protein
MQNVDPIWVLGDRLQIDRLEIVDPFLILVFLLLIRVGDPPKVDPSLLGDRRV